MSGQLKEVRIPFPNPIQDRFQVFSGPEDPNAGGGRHCYHVYDRAEREACAAVDMQIVEPKPLAVIQFQHGALNEPDSQINGILSTCLLTILVDHFKSFQAGAYPSRETALMITHLEEVQNWAARRADDRASRDVHGKHEK